MNLKLHYLGRPYVLVMEKLVCMYLGLEPKGRNFCFSRLFTHFPLRIKVLEFLVSTPARDSVFPYVRQGS